MDASNYAKKFLLKSKVEFYATFFPKMYCKPVTICAIYKVWTIFAAQ